MKKPPVGLFITGTNTEVGKTYVAALIAKSLVASGHRVGVYKPVASGCSRGPDGLIADDAVQLWQAAGKPGKLADVAPQCFEAPLAPHLAAREEGRQVDAGLLRSGLAHWEGRCDIVIVEGAGGLLSPISDSDFAIDLAVDFGYPLVVVAANTLGVINQTLQTVRLAETTEGAPQVAGVMLNNVKPSGEDISRSTNGRELNRLSSVPLLTEVAFQAEEFDRPIDWFELAMGER